MKTRDKGALNDLSVAVEFLMVAIRALACEGNLANKDVQEPLDWALRKLHPLANQSPKGNCTSDDPG